MEEYILIINQETTSIQAVLFDKLRNKKAMFQKEIPQYSSKSGFVELDANEIWISVMYVVMELMKKNQIEPESITEIGIVSKNETTVVWDKTTGVPVYYAISDQSKQSDAICEEMKDAGYEQFIKEKTGLSLQSNCSAAKIKWILDNVSGARKKAQAGELIFGMLDSWLVYRMAEQYTHMINESNASKTLLYNVHELKWDKALLHLFEIPETMVPKVKKTSEIYGYTAPYHFFGLKVPITGVSQELQEVLLDERY